MNIYFTQFWRQKNPRSRCQYIGCLVRSYFLVHRWLSAHWVLMWQKEWETLRGFFYEGSNLIHEDPTNPLNHSPKAPPPNPIPLGVTTYKCVGGTQPYSA